LKEFHSGGSGKHNRSHISAAHFVAEAYESASQHFAAPDERREPLDSILAPEIDAREILLFSLEKNVEIGFDFFPLLFEKFHWITSFLPTRLKRLS